MLAPQQAQVEEPHLQQHEALDEHGEHIQKKADHGQMNLSEKMAAHSEAFTYENEAEEEEPQGRATGNEQEGAAPKEERLGMNKGPGDQAPLSTSACWTRSSCAGTSARCP